MYGNLYHQHYRQMHSATRLAAGELRRQAIRDVSVRTGRAAWRLLHALWHPIAPQLTREA